MFLFFYIITLTDIRKNQTANHGMNVFIRELLATDIHEDHNVAAEHPKILTELLAAIRKEHRDSKDFEITLPKF